MHKVPLGSIWVSTPDGALHDMNLSGSGVEGLVMHSKHICFPTPIAYDVAFGWTMTKLSS